MEMRFRQMMTLGAAGGLSLALAGVGVSSVLANHNSAPSSVVRLVDGRRGLDDVASSPSPTTSPATAPSPEASPEAEPERNDATGPQDEANETVEDVNDASEVEDSPRAPAVSTPTPRPAATPAVSNEGSGSSNSGRGGSDDGSGHDATDDRSGSGTDGGGGRGSDDPSGHN